MSLPTQQLNRSGLDSHTWSLARTVRASLRDLVHADTTPRAPGDRPPAAGLLPLATRIKHQLQAAFDRGEQAAVADFLDVHPELTAHPQVMLSLLFEEFCLREQHGHAPNPESFCSRYEPWRDSLAAQIRVHHELSRRVVLTDDLVAFPESGDRVLHYELLDELGEGGSARVFVARNPLLGGRLCALKLSMDRGAEAALQGRLDHPHIIPVHSVEHDAEWNLRALCMPFVPGVVLATVIEQLHHGSPPREAEALRLAVSSGAENANADAGASEPESPDSWPGFPTGRSFAEAVAWVGLKLAEALEHAHGRGVFHRDIKPANILLTGRHGPMLFDFNLAHESTPGQDAAAAATGGTLPYMAPEQLAAFLDSRRWRDVAAPADLYSLGLVLRELLAGPVPAPAPVPASQTTQLIADLWARRCTEPPGPVRSPSQRVPYALDAILGRCLEPDLSRRYQCAGELAEDLRRFLHHQPLRHAVNPSRRERMINTLRRRRSALTLAACAAALLAVAGAFWSFREAPQTGPEVASLLVEEGGVRTRVGQLDEAAARFHEAIEADRTLYTPHMGLARIAYQRMQYEDSASHYTRALALMPADKDDRVIALDGRGRSRFNMASPQQQAAFRLYNHNGRQRNETADRLMQRAADAYAQSRDDFNAALALARNGSDTGAINPAFLADIEQRLTTALLGVGDAASWFEDYQTSVASYRQALQHAENHLGYLTARLGPDAVVSDIPTTELRRLERAESEIRSLLTALQERLQADEPKHGILVHSE